MSPGIYVLKEESLRVDQKLCCSGERRGSGPRGMVDICNRWQLNSSMSSGSGRDFIKSISVDLYVNMFGGSGHSTHLTDLC